eukprot:gnl/Chilomastix_caulleri/1635.p2 GENE.gnl/Chilomastix_caulleri/1635~~gnl/Chilomastix_caulleri/1635.p2  ORF type:complete len:134 (+),score=29.06 gnl/Chilomastix_caulleri/1635:316-717(+)
MFVVAGVELNCPKGSPELSVSKASNNLSMSSLSSLLLEELLACAVCALLVSTPEGCVWEPPFVVPSSSSSSSSSNGLKVALTPNSLWDDWSWCWCWGWPSGLFGRMGCCSCSGSRLLYCFLQWDCVGCALLTE